uniref:Methyltransferase type 12 domain-containing protein n=1 Tax=Bryopsis sp. HV04063 TaxID=1979421 RepID=A0A2P0QH59_9CHLO|nr:hypothetical protein [Bryopsis sp. HV04063]ARO74106.1 hypothetical protein [Bryopsis sp. HV04063]
MYKSQSSMDLVQSGHQCSGNIDKLKHHYETVSVQYNKQVLKSGYVAPKNLVSFTKTFTVDSIPLTDLEILDVGCGTGLVGIELYKHGFTKIDGIDLSIQMIKQADKLNIYRKLISDIDIQVPNLAEKIGKYDLLVACGIFTLGHVVPESLYNLLACLKITGLITLTARNSYANKYKFHEFILDSEKKGILQIVDYLPNQPYHDEKCEYWALRPKN